ncbi:MAG: hypothetical protein EDM74_11580, partial [Armatimonadetes bacterium]
MVLNLAAFDLEHPDHMPERDHQPAVLLVLVRGRAGVRKGEPDDGVEHGVIEGADIEVDLVAHSDGAGWGVVDEALAEQHLIAVLSPSDGSDSGLPNGPKRLAERLGAELLVKGLELVADPFTFSGSLARNGGHHLLNRTDLRPRTSAWRSSTTRRRRPPSPSASCRRSPS